MYDETPVCVSMCCFLPREREATLIILRDENVEERYLMLPELGRLLQALTGTLPGMLCSRLGMK